MFLNTVNETISLVTTAAGSITYVCSAGATPQTPNVNTQGVVTTAATTTIVNAPAAGAARSLYRANITNTSTTVSQRVEVNFVDAGVSYQVAVAFLRPGDVLLFDGAEWKTLKYSRAETYPSYFSKIGTQPELVGVWHSFAFAPGNPGAWSPGVLSINGAAVSDAPGSLVFDSSTDGEEYLSSLICQASVATTVYYHDILWVGTIDHTSVVAQPIVSPAWPARDVDGSSDGRGVMVGLLLETATTNANNVTATLTYTSSDGVASRTGTATVPLQANAGTLVWFSLQAGDKGVKSVESIILSLSFVTGVVRIIAGRVVANVGLPTPNAGVASPVGSGVRLWPGSSIFIAQIPSITTATTITGNAQIDIR